MRNNCSKIRIVALLMVMLLTTVSTWAYRVRFDVNGGSNCADVNTTQEFKLPNTTKADNFLVGWFVGNTYIGKPGDVYKPTENVILEADWAEIEGTTTIGSNKKYTSSGEVFSKGYKIGSNQQCEFTFRNSRRSDTDDKWANWNMWAYSSWRTDWGNRKDYFYLDLAPCVRKHITAGDNFWANNEETAVLIKQDNGELSILTDEQWIQFLEDMSDNAYVSVKVYNYDGKIRVYSVMQDRLRRRTYVYPYEYTKFDGNKDGDVWIHFSVDRTVLTNFSVSDPVGVARVNYKLDYTTDYGPRNCSMAVTTPDGLELAKGTALARGEKVVFKVGLGYKWTLTKWGSVNSTNLVRTITVTDGHANSGWITPTATLVYTGLNIANNREFHLDFEGMSNDNLIKVVDYPDGSSNAPIGKPTDDQKGQFYLYGGKGRILHDDVFGNYYQNLAVTPNEYTASKSENFLRYILTEDEKNRIAGGINIHDGAKAATIGFWVNGKVAVDYELPLERGSMFCMFSDERFRKADDMNEKPRFMFDISCNGWIYSYMPNTIIDKDENNNDILDEHGNPVLLEYGNKFFYGETAPVLEDGMTPKASLFGKNNYAHAQDQRQHKFYDDKRWHYVTYVAEEDLKKVTMYLDGEKTGELDTRSLGDMQFFDQDGDYPGRVWYLRNLVLGGFTPHGLFFEKQFYSDAALAYDDISIYSVALTQDQIKDIINEKGYTVTQKEWHFTEALKAYGASGEALDANTWESKGNGVYRLIKKSNNHGVESADDDTKRSLALASTEGLTFAGSKGDIYVDLKNGRIGLTREAAIFIPKVEKTEHLYFIAKPDDEVNYPLDHFDLYPYKDAVADFYTRGVSGYGGNGKEDYNLYEAYKRTDMAKDCGFIAYTKHYNNNNNKNILWLSDIMISKYGLGYISYEPTHKSLFEYKDKESVKYIDVNIVNNTIPTVDFPRLLVTKEGSDALNVADFSEGNRNGNPYIRFSSSAPRVAYVDKNGQVTLTGLAGHATIKAEFVFDNVRDGLISTAYTIRVTEEKKTYIAKNESGAGASVYGVGEQFTVKSNDGKTDEITLTMGGWTYTDGYGANGDVVDSWSNGFGFLNSGDIESIDGITTASEGSQNATSESYLNKDENGDIISYGEYSPAITSEANNTPWTLPSRGAYLKFEPNKAGVLTVYVLQNGNLQKSNVNQNYSDQIKWRPVYVTDETGAVVSDVRVVTNSKISENDNFFREGRRRAQFIENEEGTYNQHLKDALLQLKGENSERFYLLINNWENAGWKQKIIETGDGGYMVMSKGIVRYTFNVYPGKTYYIFSNHTKIAYSGYHFEEGKLINKNSFETAPIRPATTGNEIVFEDKLNTRPTFPTGQDLTPVTYRRPFALNTWSSICLPFSMNSKQVKEVFGDSTSVVILKNIHDDGKIELVWHTNQDIIAGYPYFILPRSNDRNRNESRETINNFSKVNVHFESSNPLFVVGSDGNTYNEGYGYKPKYPYVFEGNFEDEELPAGSYVMSNSGVLTKLKNKATAKPFRAYIRCFDSANAKPLTTMGFSDSEGETTSIEELLQDNGIILESSDVYGVNGVKVRSNTHSLEGLSKGIYVVNGKKYVVK